MLSHVDQHGNARMVNVSRKRATMRQAIVQGIVTLSREAFVALQRASLEKGDALTVAKLAGIQAAKRTAELIPLAHPLPIEHLEVTFSPEETSCCVRVTATAVTTAKTGIELEAFVAAAIAALALYDMIKAVDPGAKVTDLALIKKTGGRQPFRRDVPCEQPS